VMLGWHGLAPGGGQLAHRWMQQHCMDASARMDPLVPAQHARQRLQPHSPVSLLTGLVLASACARNSEI
jgi:hypothetical protein